MEDTATDAALLEAWGNGSTRAGNELLERHFALVHRFFRNKVGTELEDLVQQTFLACLEARSRYRGHASFKTYLLAIARNQLFTHYSQRGRRALDTEMRSVRDLRSSPTAAMAKREDVRLLQAALQEIPLDFQIILELVFWEELDAVEIAAVLDVPVNTLYSRLHRAKLALRSKLQRDRPPSPSPST
jgi:RNA polymerase sigma factor (sigma-70 family)